MDWLKENSFLAGWLALPVSIFALSFLAIIFNRRRDK